MTILNEIFTHLNYLKDIDLLFYTNLDIINQLGLSMY